MRESESGERQGGEEKSIMSSDFLLFGWEESFPSQKKTEKVVLFTVKIYYNSVWFMLILLFGGIKDGF